MALCGVMIMGYRPRYYQLNAIDAAMNWVKSTTDNGLIEAFQGAGKSNIIAEIAKRIASISGKQVLCLVPSVELLLQNEEKFRLINEPVSLFSASAKSTSVRHPCVIGTPMSVKNKLNVFKNQFAAIILDEADRSITPTILSIINHIRGLNPNLRVLGLTGTPFTLRNGYIYRLTHDNKTLAEGKAKDPFFTKQIFKIGRRELTEEGFLVPVIFGEISADKYDTKSLELNHMNKFDSKEIDRVFVGQGRKTAAIVADVIARAKNRNCVIFYAATIKHAEEILASLPSGISAIVTGKKTDGRERIIKDYKAGKIRYIVNCNVLTVGFDDPKTDTIAVLRKTESSSLYLQIIGRGVRTMYAAGHDLESKDGRLQAIANSSKRECLVLDYTDNPSFHFNDYDIDSPQIKSRNASGGEGGEIPVICPHCRTENLFTPRPNPDRFEYSEDGYFVDLLGEKIQSEYGPMPSHFGRRCYGMHPMRGGKYEQCGYYWTFKTCEECGEKADIAARYCPNKHELIDPNTKLIGEFTAMKRDPYQVQCDEVLAWETKKTLSAAGNECLKVDFTTEYRSFSVWYQVQSGNAYLIKQYEKFLEATQGGDIMPKSITYRKSIKTGFYEALGYNSEPDKLELK